MLAQSISVLNAEAFRANLGKVFSSIADIAITLLAKGVLTEAEGELLTKGLNVEIAGSAKKLKILEQN